MNPLKSPSVWKLGQTLLKSNVPQNGNQGFQADFTAPHNI